MYNISYKTFIGAKPFRIMVDKVDEFFRLCDENRYLVLFEVDSYDFLLLDKTLIFRNVTIIIKLVSNKDKDNYYYYIFLEKGSNKLPKNNDCK